MAGNNGGQRNSPSRARVWAVVAVILILAVGAYLFATYFAGGQGSSTGGTTGPRNSQTNTSQPTFQTSAPPITSNTLGQQTVNLDSYNWKDLNNLTVVLSDNGSTPIVIRAVNLGGTVAKSVNASVSAAGGCTPTGASAPFKTPVTCNPGESVTLFISPAPGVGATATGGGYTLELIVSQGNTEGYPTFLVVTGSSG